MKTAAHTLKSILATAYLLLTILTLLGAWGGLVDPSSTPIPALAAMIFPIAATLCLLLVLIHLFVMRRFIILPLIALLGSAPTIAAICPVHFGRHDIPHCDSSRVINILSYNVFNFRDYRAPHSDTPSLPILRAILDSHADIVALQEYTPDIARCNPHGAALLDSLFDAYPYHIDGTRGQAIFSIHPLLPLPDPTPTHPYFMQPALTVVGSDTILLLNVHLQSVGLTDDDRNYFMSLTTGHPGMHPLGDTRRRLLSKFSASLRLRQIQALEIRSYIDSVAGTRPVILCGDFNDIPLSYAGRTILSAGLSDAYRDAGCGPAISYHAGRILFRIDHLFYSTGRFTPLSAHFLHIKASDHYPLATTLYVNQ